MHSILLLQLAGECLAAGMLLAMATWAAYAALVWIRYGHPKPPGNPGEQDPLLDRFMPAYEVVDRHSAHIAAPAETAFAAAAAMDLQESGIIRALFKSRDRMLGGKPELSVLPRTLIAWTKALGWTVLAEAPGREIVMGAATKPWETKVVFRPVLPAEFAAFHEPGYVKIAWTLRMDPAGPGESVARTETRATTTDLAARARFRWYWAVFSPGIHLIRRIALKLLNRKTERVSSDVAELWSSATRAVGPQQLSDRWDSLPEPVRRYLRYAIPNGAPAIRTVRLKHGGFFRIKPEQGWLPIRAVEYFTAGKPGFVWRARICPFPCIWIDACVGLFNRHGHMLVKLESLFTIADASGPEIDQGASLRWLAEAVWFPYAFVGDAIRWEPVDETAARVTLVQTTLVQEDAMVSALVEFDAEGQMIAIRGQRYRDLGAGKARLTPWLGRCGEYREFGGFRVPTHVEATWVIDGAEFTYARFDVTAVEFNVV